MKFDNKLLLVAGTCIVSFLVFAPWSSIAIPTMAANDFARLWQIGLMLVCAAAAWASPHRQHLTAQAGRSWFLTLPVLALGSLSVGHADQVGWAMKEATLWIGMGFVAWAVSMQKNEHLHRILLPAVATSALFVNLLNLALPLASMALDGIQPHPEHLILGYGNRRFFNHVQTVGLPLLVLASCTASAPWLRSVSIAALVSGFTLLFATEGRATLLALAAASTLALLTCPRHARQLLKTMVLGGVLGYVACLLLFTALPEMMALSPSGDLVHRIQETHTVDLRHRLLRLALADTMRAPWVGIGPMHFAHYTNPVAAHPHNVYLQVSAEWGLPMLSVFLASCGALVMAVARRIRSLSPTPNMESHTGCVLFMALIGVLIDGLFSGNFVMAAPQVWIAVTVGWSIAWLPPREATSHNGMMPIHTVIGMALLALGTACIMWLTMDTAQELPHLDQWLKASEALNPNAKLMPRFWSSGWF